MKIAVTYENEQVFQHFGQTKYFKIYDCADGKVIKSEIVDTNGSGHGALAGFLKNLGVEALICGGIGQGAQDALTAAGIKFLGGVTGNTDAVISCFLCNILKFDPNVKCNHHDKEGHHEHSSCGEHGCSKH